MKWASSHSSSASFQDRIWASASAPVMKNSSASGRCGAQVAQGVDRVGRAVAVDVDPADGEAGVGCRRDDGHEVAVLGRRDVAAVLLPRLARGDEDDLVEPEPGLHLAGGDEVTVVDGVEGPTHHPEPHACGAQWWPCPGWSRPVRLVRGGLGRARPRRRRAGRPGRGSARAYFWAVPRKDHVTPSRNANAHEGDDTRTATGASGARGRWAAPRSGSGRRSSTCGSA